MCVWGGAPATQASVTLSFSRASLWLAGKGIGDRAKMRLVPAGTFFEPSGGHDLLWGQIFTPNYETACLDNCLTTQAQNIVL